MIASLIESDQFEISLNKIVAKRSTDLNIAKSAAMNIVLEEIRDLLRKEGFDNFDFSREDFDEDEAE